MKMSIPTENVHGYDNPGYGYDNPGYGDDFQDKSPKYEASEGMDNSEERADESSFNYEFRIVDDKPQVFSISDCIEQSMKLVKVLTAVLLWCFILGSTIISKGTVLYTVSQINSYVQFQRASDSLLANSNISEADDIHCGMPVCLQVDDVDCTKKESVRWIWCLFLCQCVPYFVTLVKALWMICFKKKKPLQLLSFVVAFISTTIHQIGLCLLFYVILPKLDVFRSLLLFSGVGLIPSLLPLFLRPKRNKWLNLLGDILACLGQITIIVPIIATAALDKNNSNGETTDQWVNLCTNNPPVATSSPPISSTVGTTIDQTLEDLQYPYRHIDEKMRLSLQDSILLVVALTAISIEYCGNFIAFGESKNVKGVLSHFFNNYKLKSAKSRTKTEAIVNLWKIILTFCFILIYFGAIEDRFDMIMSTENFYDNTCGKYGDENNGDFYTDWIEVAAINICLGSLLCWLASVFAIRGHMQLMSFTGAMFLSTPLSFVLLFWSCTKCDSTWDFGTQFYWNCFSGYQNFVDLFIDENVWIGFIYFVSMVILTRYICTSQAMRLEKVQRLFTQYAPCGILLEQSMMLIRVRKDTRNTSTMTNLNSEKSKEKWPFSGDANGIMADQLKGFYVPSFLDEKIHDIPFIYMCATMWHENKIEMVQMLKSFFRVNSHQCAREKAMQHCNIRADDYFKFEAHIFFDDAFTPHDQNDTNYGVNEFVKTFVSLMDIAASTVLNIPYHEDPVKYRTPYGGRLEWVFPLGTNKLVVHLKDKQKIRNRKRWSQIMYLHYILGQGIMSQKVSDNIKYLVSQNTYILALDGDTDFQPKAVTLLVDLMRRNLDLGAACGRIHPKGNGPIVWYQKFEYSISHWFQKSTEHILGCVLCSPGCFSLFRARALMDENVVQTYTKRAQKPTEYIQYDQGEDRWLCTLLLQQGYRVEYSAAADAFTYAPESFDEFYNQRRRWITSTFANILDLLRTGRETAVKNENISMLYIAYQWLLMIISIFGPGTIFILIIGALNIGFGWDMTITFFVTLIPVLGYGLICYKAKTSTQGIVIALIFVAETKNPSATIHLFFAKILSLGTALLQMLVIVGIMVQLIEDGICSPSSAFFLFVVGAFLLAALLHPQEIFNIIHGIPYFFFIPSMYLVLIIYSLVNLHVISWGTREVKPTPTEKEEEVKTKAGGTSYLSDLSQMKENGLVIDCSPICRFECCKNRQENDEVVVLPHKTIEPDTNPKVVDTQQIEVQIEPETNLNSSCSNTENKENFWIDDPMLGNGDIKEIDNIEETFWTNLIFNYLYPLEENKIEKEKITQSLLELRKKAVFTFFIMDMLFIVLFFALSIVNECDKQAEPNCTGPLEVQWVCSIDGKSYVSAIGPIDFAFIIVFGFILSLQLFFGMLPHRVFTFLQLLASTVVFGSKYDTVGNSGDANEKQNSEKVIELMNQLQTFDVADDMKKTSVDSIDMDQTTDFIRRLTVTQPVYTRDDITRKMSARFICLDKKIAEKIDVVTPDKIVRKNSKPQLAIDALRDKHVHWNENLIQVQPSEDELKKADQFLTNISKDGMQNKRRTSLKPNLHAKRKVRFMQEKPPGEMSGNDSSGSGSHKEPNQLNGVLSILHEVEEKTDGTNSTAF